MSKNKILYLKFFEANILFLSGSEKRCNKVLDKMFPGQDNNVIPPQTDGIATVMEHPTAPAVYVLWVRKKSLPLIAHEAVHLASFILKDRGIEANSLLAYEETLAYTVQNILRLIEEDKNGK